MALTDKLTAIANAIRSKTGKTETMTLDQMPTEIEAISGGGDLPTLSYDFTRISSTSGSEHAAFIGVITKKAIKAGLVEKQILIDSSAKSPEYMYMKTPDAKLPDLIISVSSSSCSYILYYSVIKEENLPKISTTGSGSVYSLQAAFSYCTYLRSIPEDYFDNVSFTNTIIYANMFSYCYSLRSVPSRVLSKLITNSNYYTYQLSYYGFTNCYSLDEIVGLTITKLSGTNALTNNMFSSSFNNCSRLSRLVFNAPESSYRMKSQTIDLSNNIGYGTSYNFSEAIKRNAGYTTADLVNSDETYAEKKNSPNWYTQNMKWSRYNKASAIETIASLPDTSEYLASAGGTNTIKFRGNAGSNTDGGAINTMTADEIAVATAKGWTVTFS